LVDAAAVVDQAALTAHNLIFALLSRHTAEQADDAMSEITFIFGPGDSFFFDTPKVWKL
jgi:hypothetical protein